jgi:hypothetical protein
MTVIVGHSAKIIMISAVLNKVPAEDLILRLYQNDITPAPDYTTEDYIEVNSNGYGGQVLNANDWEITADDHVKAIHLPVHFTFTGETGDIFGYYITQDVSGELMWAERFDNTIYIRNPGDEIRVEPAITLL